jgi:hypothetical protein
MGEEIPITRRFSQKAVLACGNGCSYGCAGEHPANVRRLRSE